MFEFSAFTRGNPCHPALIFLHGFLGVKEDWEQMVPFFEKDFFCVAIDLPGHGLSAYRSEIVSAIRCALEKFSPKPVLIGYSMGGRVALQLQDAASAVVALSAHLGLKTKREREERRKIDEKWAEKILHSSWPDFLRKWYAQPVFHSLNKTEMIKRRSRQGPGECAKVLSQLSLANQMPITEFLKPTLFLYGEDDWKYEEHYSTLASSISVRRIKNAGHCLHLENPADSAHEILKWLKGHANT